MEGSLKTFKGADFIKLTSSAEEATNLHTQLKLCLSVTGELLPPDQMSEQRVVCDRVLRACNHWAGDPSCHIYHLQTLVPLAVLVCHGFCAASSQRTPFYLEKILFHLLKNVSARESSFQASTHLSNLLYSLLSCLSSEQKIASDFKALTKSSFQTLWKAAGDQEQNQSHCTYNREALSLRLHALRFLLLAEASVLHGDAPVSISRHARCATLAFEPKGKPCSKEEAQFMSQSIEDFLLIPLVQIGAVTGPWAGCLVELTLERCRRLCKSCCFEQGRDIVKQAGGHLKNAGKCCRTGLTLLNFALDLQESGRLSRIDTVLSELTETIKGGFSLAGDGWKCQALSECFQFAVSCLDVISKNPTMQETNYLLSLANLLEKHYRILEKQMAVVSKDMTKQLKLLKQQQFSGLQQFTNAACALMQTSKDTSCEEMLMLHRACQDAVSRMHNSLEDLPAHDSAEFLNITASCVHNMAYWFYSQKKYLEASNLVSPLCQWLAKGDPNDDSNLSVERLHRCYRLQVESCRKSGQTKKGLDAVSLWLRALRSKVSQQMAEPVALWVRLKMDGAKSGDEDLRLHTLKDGLTDYPLDPELMVSLLAEELKGYKSVHGDTGQERYNAICDLLEFCTEDGNLKVQRATFLLELAQVLCYHDYTLQTDCSALDAVHEALQILDFALQSTENSAHMQDIKAQALLWQYICTLEANMREGLEQQNRKAKIQSQNQWTGVDYEPNDLNYEDKLHDDQSIRDGICFTLAGEAGPMKCLDEALDLWEGLLSHSQIPSLNNVEQTVFSIHLLGSLFRLMGKPLQSLRSFCLARRLCHSLEDYIREAGVLCHLTKMFFYLDSPQLAQVTLQDAGEILKCVDCNHENYTLIELSFKLLTSHLYRVTNKIKEGVELLLGLLQHPSLQKSSKAWYLLKVQVLQELSMFLELPSSTLNPNLYKQLLSHGCHTPETALTEAHKLLRSIVLLLLGSDVLSSPKSFSEGRFVDNGENLLQKWQVLADLLSCTQDLVATLCRMGCVSEAKSFCLEGLRVAKNLQSMRLCADFLVRKAELETLRSETQLCEGDLQYVLFLIESCTDFTSKAQNKEIKVKLSKSKQLHKTKPPKSPSSPPKDDFLKAVDLRYVETRVFVKAPESPTSTQSTENNSPCFLSHMQDCSCHLCSDLVLSLLCTRWLVAKAENNSINGDLLKSALKRCISQTKHFSGIVQKMLRKEFSKPTMTLGIFDELTARVYLDLTSPCHCDKLPNGMLEAGLKFVSLRTATFPLHWRAGLLLTKALSFIYELAAKHGSCVSDIFLQLWGWQPKKDHKKASDQKDKSKALTNIVLGSEKKSLQKNVVAHQALHPIEDSDTEHQPVSTKPQTTPTQQSRAASRAKSTVSTLSKRNTVIVYTEKSPMPEVLPRAPRRHKTRTVLKVDFSDSDLEVPDNPEREKISSNRKQSLRTKPGTRKNSVAQGPLESDDEEYTNKSKGRTKRSSTKKVQKEGSPSVPLRRRQQEKLNIAPKEVEILRSIEEEAECKLDISIEQLRGSDTEEQTSLRTVRKSKKPSKKDGLVTECEVLRRDAGLDMSWSLDMKGNEADQNPFSITGRSSSQPIIFGNSDLSSVSALLCEALQSVSHFPPSNLYSRLCRLLALCSGGQDPYFTALLVSESVSITLRHQLLSEIHRKSRKLRRDSSGDVCEKFQSLALEDQKDSQIQHLSQLDKLFRFPHEALNINRFQEQLQQIPENTAMCILTLADSQKRIPGDILLLTRLVQGRPPVTVQIPTAHLKMPISSILQEFEEIQKQQKVINSLTDKKEWWEGRMDLDSRMKALIHLLEDQVLGYWKVLLTPPCTSSIVTEENDKLSKALSDCGWQGTNSELLKTFLGGSHILTPKLVQSFTDGIYFSRHKLAQTLLQDATDRLKSTTEKTGGHLVLVLDKHLQKLPWESIPCVQKQPVTRLPCLYFLLSYNLLKKYQPQTTLVKGVDPKEAFYVLNPHANLPGTEERFRDWFKSEPGWKGVIRTAPKPEIIQSALAKLDMYM
ncbi:hypothetical protein GDO86_004461 [Hymenochirus boettgeri]|uniref:separase n=1 Tax=Hymenochirus boettgeri TaxID=247094 RepID=A0A8T2K613_9PIPI|nr:hypothetical protein GDO86_004461 [Hymenochirus boettgeri]